MLDKVTVFITVPYFLNIFLHLLTSRQFIKLPISPHLGFASDTGLVLGIPTPDLPTLNKSDDVINIGVSRQRKTI